MSSMRTYTARVSREGKWWIIRVTDFDDAVTQARRLGEVEDTARDMVAAMLDTEPSDIKVDVQIEAIEDLRVTTMLDQLESSRQEMEDARARYSERLRSDARRMASQGLTVREIGQVLSMSYQRAQQLLEHGARVSTPVKSATRKQASRTAARGSHARSRSAPAAGKKTKTTPRSSAKTPR